MHHRRTSARYLTWTLLASAPLLAVALTAACNEDEDRCSHDSDCPAGQVCSNENDQQGQGICLAVCDSHINTAACDSGAASDAKSESSSSDGAAKDGANADAPGNDAEAVDAAKGAEQ